ncbi:major capsid protein [Rhizobium sp. 9140]|uniref:major capsid protein n=1 Tax=Rhizobium sp. 9140 TaxID=1761900 RepID=UPI00079B1B14|nr:major capsid protein [Rhizobium sp. 9140]CZT36421.1 Phage major capsid protein E [Rhizobium sp. 9140]
MAGQPFPVDPVLTGIAVAFKNGELIADQVMPRLEPRLTAETFKYMVFGFDQTITIPDTKVGRKSEPNIMEFGGTEVTGATADYGQDAIIPIADIMQAPAGYDPEAFAVQQLTNIVELDREKRVADKTFNPLSYPTTNREVLSGTSQWSHADSKPIRAVTDALDSMVMRANVAVMGRLAWSQMRQNPNVLRALTTSGVADGLADKRAVADLLELDDIVVGSGFANAARPGQPAVRYRLWGKHCALIRREKIVSSMGEVPTWGWTAQFGTRVAGSIDEPKIGLRGSRRVRAGESVAEVVSAPELGYFFQNVAA